jgi:hypothetical protein
LEREVNAAARLHHRGSLVARSLSMHRGSPVLVMPLFDGVSLTEHVAAHGPLADDGLRTLGSRLAGALGEAHRKGLLHGDVTPNNVLVRGDNAVLTDFGLSRLARRAVEWEAMVTPGYAPPEAYQDAWADPRADLYGLGAVLYFAATGHHAFRAPTPAKLLELQLAGSFTPLLERRPWLAPDLAATIERLLAPRPHGRPGAASEVEQALHGGHAVATPLAAIRQSDPDAAIRDALAKASAPPPVELPEGPYTVIVIRRPKGPFPEGILDAISDAAGLPRGSLAAAPALDRPQFRLLQHVTREVAGPLCVGAAKLGITTKVVDTRASSALPWITPLLPLSLGVVWMGLGVFWVPLCAAALAPLIAAAWWVAQRKSPDRLPLAYARQLTQYVVPNVGPANMSGEVTITDQPDGPTPLGERARNAARGLRRSMEVEPVPPKVLAKLRPVLDGLQGAIDACEAAQLTGGHTGPPPVDRAWLAGRLKRLQEQEAKGEASEQEQARVAESVAALETAEAAQDAESAKRLAAHTRLLELAAVTDQVRSDLITLGDQLDATIERLSLAIKAARSMRRRSPKSKPPTSLAK